MQTLLAITLGLVLGGGLIFLLMRRFGRRAPLERIETTTIFERVSAVGQLVGLEVHAKEIATSVKGLSWLPPLLLSPAKVAMIFQFEKRYYVDLAMLDASDVELVEPGRFRLRLPQIEGKLRLIDVTPYDISAGRVMGLLDVIQVNAQTQQELIRKAQDQASDLYEQNEAKYLAQARRSIERQIHALLSLFDVRIEIEWAEALADEGRAPARTPEPAGA